MKHKVELTQKMVDAVYYALQSREMDLHDMIKRAGEGAGTLEEELADVVEALEIFEIVVKYFKNSINNIFNIFFPH